MQPYNNLSGNSGIIAYAIGDDYIDVQFHSGVTYRYSYVSTGMERVEQMKQLAVQGQGLNSFISRFVKTDYAARF